MLAREPGQRQRLVSAVTAPGIHASSVDPAFCLAAECCRAQRYQRARAPSPAHPPPRHLSKRAAYLSVRNAHTRKRRAPSAVSPQFLSLPRRKARSSIRCAAVGAAITSQSHPRAPQANKNHNGVSFSHNFSFSGVHHDLAIVPRKLLRQSRGDTGDFRTSVCQRNTVLCPRKIRNLGCLSAVPPFATTHWAPTPLHTRSPDGAKRSPRPSRRRSRRNFRHEHGFFGDDFWDHRTALSLLYLIMTSVRRQRGLRGRARSPGLDRQRLRAPSRNGASPRSEEPRCAARRAGGGEAHRGAGARRETRVGGGGGGGGPGGGWGAVGSRARGPTRRGQRWEQQGRPRGAGKGDGRWGGHAARLEGNGRRTAAAGGGALRGGAGQTGQD